jgi:5-methylthioadenosine/S-adenosylhomocysteine deaminase
VWLDDEELGAIAGAGAALVHCPGSNLKLGSGLARVRAWKDARIRCGLGSDGAACNNRLDTFHEMSLAGLVSRVRPAATGETGGVAPLTALEVVSLATRDGARALGLGEAIGTLEVGRQADVTVIDVRGPHHGPDPEGDPHATLVHAARANDVRATMVAGRVLYRDGRFATLDPEAAVADARAEARGVLRRAGLA